MPLRNITAQEAKRRLEKLEELYFVQGCDENGRDPWTQDPLHSMKMPTLDLSQADPNAMDTPDEDTFLYRFLALAINQPTNKPLLPQFQKEGTCVGQSDKLTNDTVMGVESMMYDLVFPGRAAVATGYTGGRVEIGKQPGAWDGSNCGWSGQFDTDFGIGLLRDLGLPEDALDSDEDLAVKWTKTRDGVPDKFEKLCKVRAVEKLLRPKDAREVGKSIQMGIPFFHGSNLIPSGKVDKYGFSPAKRSRGGHAVGWFAVRYNPFGLLYWNSWGINWGRTEQHQEGAGAYVADQPLGSVWLNEDESNAIVSQRDCYGKIGVKGLLAMQQNALRVVSAVRGIITTA